MSKDRTEAWYDPVKKNKAVYKVLRYLAKHPAEGLKCVGKDDAARTLFEEQGKIKVPTDKGARVLFFPQHEQDSVGASVILEIPPNGLTDPTDDELQPFVLGNYPYWPPK